MSIAVLEERGFVKDCTNIANLRILDQSRSITAYVGFDATAPRLHVGSLIQLMAVRHLLRAGHQVIVLLGGATTRVGDPTGKDATRPRLSESDIGKNLSGISDTIFRFIASNQNDRNNFPTIVNNLDWMSKVSYMDFLTNIAPHFTVNRMLSMDSVRDRLARQNPMTVLEFNYSMMQGMDFLHLFREHRCNLQIGGSDQWSNILSGTELVRRVEDKNVYGLTTPLMTNSAGHKMGKTADGAVWLGEPTSAQGFWQFWRNVEDSKVAEFLALFTDLPMEEVRRLSALEGAEINEAKKVLATQVTTLVYGQKVAQKEQRIADEVFEEGKGALQNVEVNAELWETATLPVIMREIGAVASRKEAERLITQGAVVLDDFKLTSEINDVIGLLRGREQANLVIGKKKRFCLVRR